MDYLGLRAHQMGVGNVYYVIQANHGEVAELTDYYEKTYVDGSTAIQSTIATALTASQAERNDYIVCRPDNDFYATSATLTMDKNDVHLIAPDGFGKNGYANFRTVIQETGSYALLTVTGHGVEIGGFFFAGKQGYSIITYGTGTVWAAYVHDNYFGMNATSGNTNNYGVYSGGSLNNYCIRDNTFSNFSPGATTGSNNAIAAFIGVTSGGSTRGLIKGNVLYTGSNTTVAAGIKAMSYEGTVIENYLWEDIAAAGVDAGTFTEGIRTGGNSFVARNVISIATAGNAVEGGTADQTHILNYEGTDGGTQTSTT